LEQKGCYITIIFKNECLEHLEKKRVNNLLDILSTKDPEQNIPKAFLPFQVQFLLDEAKNTQSAFRNYTMIWVFVGSGIRNNELVNIQIGDICEENQTIKVIAKGSSTKTKRFITKVALQVLMQYVNFRYDQHKKNLSKEDYKNLFVFSVDGHKPISTDTVRDIVDRLIKKGETKGIFPEDNDFSPHNFRHCFALYALEKGVPIYKIKKLLGHKSMKSTEVYLELYDSQMVNAIEKHPFADVELSFLKNKGDLNELNY
jgi:integrase/recombinase XerD